MVDKQGGPNLSGMSNFLKLGAFAFLSEKLNENEIQCSWPPTLFAGAVRIEGDIWIYQAQIEDLRLVYS